MYDMLVELVVDWVNETPSLCYVTCGALLECKGVRSSLTSIASNDNPRDVLKGPINVESRWDLTAVSSNIVSRSFQQLTAKRAALPLNANWNGDNESGRDTLEHTLFSYRPLLSRRRRLIWGPTLATSAFFFHHHSWTACVSLRSRIVIFQLGFTLPTRIV